MRRRLKLSSALVAELTQQIVGLRGDYVPVDHSLRVEVTQPNILIASDVHVPYHDPELVARFINHARNYDAIVWLGDLLDNPTFSSWGVEDLATTFDNELTQVEGIIRLAAERCPVQYWSLGNHEERWMRKMGYQGGMERLAKMAGLSDLLSTGRLIVSDNPTLDYHGDWMLTHPRQYGTTPLVVPGKIAERYGKNVVSAHAHHWGMGTSNSGRFTVIESGGLFEPKYVKYVQHGVTAHRAWAKGYVGLLDGQPFLIKG